MKKMAALFLSMILLMSFVGCEESSKLGESKGDKGESNSEVATPEKDYEYEEISGGLKITKYTGSDTKIVVPEVIDDKMVVSVGTTFSGNLLLEEIELPPSVKTADFQNCTALKKLDAKGVSDVGQLILSGCESLEYLSLPAITHFPVYNWQLPSSIRELILSGVTEFYLYQFPDSLKSLEVLDVSSATFIRTDYYSWPSRLKEVKINTSISWYNISSDTNNVGGVFAAYDADEQGLIEITDSNKSTVWCELFMCEEIKVNGVTYRKE